jgi:hypothetical protein
MAQAETAHAPLRGPQGTVRGPHTIHVIVVCEPAFDESAYNPHVPGSPLSPVMTVHRTLEESEVSTFGHHVRYDRTWRLLPGRPRPWWVQEVHVEIGCELDDDEDLRSRVLARIKSLWAIGWWIDRVEYRESPKPVIVLDGDRRQELLKFARLMENSPRGVPADTPRIVNKTRPI